jgi:hypothetical protein
MLVWAFWAAALAAAVRASSDVLEDEIEDMNEGA